ncbi:MAG TPA: universal stress protein [Wenzhouxiangellaceae bacterium]|nr:universal stress protein [Wenzhouxiangellaceae bacterium]
MRRILVATDFSPRADLALERAAILAATTDANLDIVHVVDPDRPRRLVAAEAGLSHDLLDEQRKLITDRHGIEASAHLYEGEPFQGIGKALDNLKPDLLVVGAYRRRLLQDTFIGTTAERAIRRSRKPVLMVNSEATEHYVHILAAVDLSPNSAQALRTVAALDLNRDAAMTVAYLYDAHAIGSISLGSLSKADIRAYLADEEALAVGELDTFLKLVEAGRVQRIVRHIDTTLAPTLQNIASELSADLLVIGAGAGSGPTRMLLGSSALEILATSRRDVLVVPHVK